MRAVLPGKPQPSLQAVSVAFWNDQRLIAYISGSAFVVLADVDTILQTVYDDDPTPLNTIAVDDATGKIATSAGRVVRVYKPYGREEGALKVGACDETELTAQWSLQTSLTIESDDVATLSWGVEEELLVGGAELTLYATCDSPRLVWHQKAANPVKCASFSYDAGYIASTGRYDKFVKVWRRLSYGTDEVRFDFSYLSHPQTVTDVYWRRPHPNQTIDNILYTVCADQVLRIWAIADQHNLQMLQLCGEIDLGISIQSRDLPSQQTPARHVFVIDGRDFSAATEHAVQNAGQDDEHNALEHLIEVANRSPEICVVLDSDGRMSVWAMENITAKKQDMTTIFNVAHVQGLPLRLRSAVNTDQHAKIYNFCNAGKGGLIVLVHQFDGRIEAFEANLASLCAPVTNEPRMTLKATWTGHSGPIKKIVRNISGSAVVSRTDDNESILWRQSGDSGGTALVRQSVIPGSEHIHRICVLGRGEYVIFLHHGKVALWDARHTQSRLLASCDYTLSGKPLCIIELPEVERHKLKMHVATISSKLTGIVWEIQLPSRRNSKLSNGDACYIREFSRFDLGTADDLAYVLPVDPAGAQTSISGFLDTFARDVAISYTQSGLLSSWTAKVDADAGKVDWLQTCSVETGIVDPTLASGSSIRKAALVNASKTELTIWDVRGGRLEYAKDFGQDTIQDLDWTSTPDEQSILSVGFNHRVMLMSQLRYDYLQEGPAWATIRIISIRDLTPHPIGDSTWLSGGNVVIGSGNQLFVYDRHINTAVAALSNLRLPHVREADWDIYDLVTRLNGSLPLFHPQLLSQCILAGKTTLVHKILATLYRVLKYHAEGEAIDNLLGMDLEDFYMGDHSVPSSTKAKSAFLDVSSPDEEDVETITESAAAGLNEKLTKTALPQLSGQEQIHLMHIIECVGLVEKHRRSMDDNAARYMLFFRQHNLHKGRANEVNLSWREINWAYHSNSQDILVDMVSNQFHGRMLWENARESGLFMWLLDSTALFETIARNEYSKTDMKDPIDCSLFYFALKKKAVVQGLWRMASWNREQGATMKLLANNFQDQKWKTVALKNAYALLGKRRFDCLKDAVNVCLNQIKDLQLAIAVARVHGGDDGPVLKELIEDQVLPLATQEGNRWLASWAFWMLHRRDMASPVSSLIETPQSPDLQSKLFLTDDPALVVLYAHLRQKTLQALRGASKVTPKVEWGFVMHSAQLYDRMGCDLLALDLVRNWEFLLPSAQPRDQMTEVDPRQLLRRRSSLVVADLPSRPFQLESKAPKGSKPPATMFEEPSASSLLDSFGF